MQRYRQSPTGQKLSSNVSLAASIANGTDQATHTVAVFYPSAAAMEADMKKDEEAAADDASNGENGWENDWDIEENGEDGDDAEEEDELPPLEAWAEEIDEAALAVQLTEDGEHIVRVYLLRSAARREESARF